MTSLSGEFQTDLSVDDAMVASTEAIDGLGWRIDTVEADRVIAFTDSDPEHPPRIEVSLSETGQGTEFRIIGSDSAQNPLEQDELIPILDRARDAINSSMEQAERPREKPSTPEGDRGDGGGRPEARPADEAAQVGADSNPRAAPGWYLDHYNETRQRYWDGAQWTDDFRSAQDEAESQSGSGAESKSRRPNRKEARAEKRQRSREQAEKQRREREAQRQERNQQRRGNSEPSDADQGTQAGSDDSQSSASEIPAKFGSLRLIATLYQYLGYVVVVGGVIAVIAAAAGAGGGDAIVILIVGAIGVAFYALLVFGIAAAIRLALAVEKNTRDTAELLKQDRGV